MKCTRIESYINGKPVYKKKHKFETLELAIAECKIVNAFTNNIHKVVSYKCPICFKYHIGRNGKEIKRK